MGKHKACRRAACVAARSLKSWTATEQAKRDKATFRLFLEMAQHVKPAKLRDAFIAAAEDALRQGPLMNERTIGVLMTTALAALKDRAFFPALINRKYDERK